METNRGDAAATTRTFRGDESRRRRGYDADIPQRRVSRRRFEYSLETGERLRYARVEDAPIRLAVAVLRAASPELLKLRSLDELVANFKGVVRRVRPRRVLLEFLGVRARPGGTLRALAPVSRRAPAPRDDDDAGTGDGDVTPPRMESPSHGVATPFGRGVVAGLAEGGRVRVRLDWGAVARLPREIVSLDSAAAPPPPPPAAASPVFTTHADFAGDY